jgi:hypothetical protein
MLWENQFKHSETSNWSKKVFEDFQISKQDSFDEFQVEEEKLIINRNSIWFQHQVRKFNLKTKGFIHRVSLHS